VLLQFELERAETLRNAETSAQSADANKELQRKIERYLDMGRGECHLGNPAIAEVVAEFLRYFDGEQYVLEEWVIMPNHVHFVIWPMPNWTLSGIMQSRKRHSAREANRLLGRTGTKFWQPEYYDHWVRDEEEKARIRRYIRNNPVKAGLCGAAEEWRWGSAWNGRCGSGLPARDTAD
jgi:REP element-mobilizing transposase RayT